MAKRVLWSTFILAIWVSAAFSQTLIPREAVFEGTFVGRDIRVDGIVKGRLSADFDVTVTVDGVVNGRIETTDLTSEGVIRGTVLALDNIFLKPTAEVAGTLQCRYLTVDKGALVSAFVSMGEIKEIGEKKEVKRVAPTRERRERRRRR